MIGNWTTSSLPRVPSHYLTSVMNPAFVLVKFMVKFLFDVKYDFYFMLIIEESL